MFIKRKDIGKSMLNFFNKRRVDGLPICMVKNQLHGFKFNVKSIMVLDDLIGPNFVYVTLSLGDKFIYDGIINESQKNMMFSAIRAMMEKMN